MVFRLISYTVFNQGVKFAKTVRAPDYRKDRMGLPNSPLRLLKPVYFPSIITVGG